jgi:hypothetical protein
MKLTDKLKKARESALPARVRLKGEMTPPTPDAEWFRTIAQRAKADVAALAEKARANLTSLIQSAICERGERGVKNHHKDAKTRGITKA